MATVPADNQVGSPSSGGPLQSSLLDGMGGLGVLRQIGLMLGLAASVAIGVAVVLWSQEPDWRPLYGSLDRLDAVEVSKILDSNQIEYKIDSSSGALLVDSNKIHQARLKLAEAGMPGDSNAGFELLDQEQPLGTSQFMETARYRRSLEGELARTISSIQAVRGARVHLAIPKQSVFVRDQRKPSASIFVELFPGRTLTVPQVKAIANLVAASITQLSIEDVTVVDQKGNLLSKFTEEDSQMAAANRHLEYTRKMEQTLVRRIHSILEPMLGTGRFHAEVSADIDFTAVEQTDELFNPDLPAVRSEQVLAEQRGAGATAGGIPGALSNQPPADGAAPEVVGAAAAGVAGTQESGPYRRQEVRNYELDRTISHTRHQVGRLRRLTVAVAVDDIQQADAEGATKSIPWQQGELERISILVRNAVGFDPTRGDSVEVINTPFLVEKEAEVEVEAPPIWQEPWVVNLIKQVAAALFVLILVFGVLRPVMKSLTSASRESRDMEGGGTLGDLSDELGGALGDETVTLSGGDSMLLPGPQGGSYDQQMNAIKGMVAEDPARVAQVVRQWIASE